MDYTELENLSLESLQNLAEEMNLNIDGNKKYLLKNIIEAFKEYEKYKKDKIDKYTIIKQLGDSGQQGTTYLVQTKSGKEYAMKTFRKTKSSTTLRKEAELQKMASDFGIAPNVIDLDTVSKYIIMERMDYHLVNKNSKILTKKQQKEIIQIHKKLDEAKIFHGDANILNFMYKDDILYIIDFGMAKEITKTLITNLGTDKPNMHIMALGLALKLRESGYTYESYKYLVKHLSDEQKEQFGFIDIDSD